MWLAFKRVAPIAFLGAVPALLYLIAVVRALGGHDLGVDFQGELYPEAKLVLHGINPFPPPHSDLSGGVNRIFPIPAALLAAPLTVFPAAAAAAIFVVALFAALMATGWILGVRDWRIAGVVAMWPSTIAALQTGNVTILIGLLIAVAWRWRNRPYLPGIAIGGAIALKLFAWPVLLLLLAMGRYRAVAAGVAVTIASFLVVLPFASLGDFARLMNHLGNTFGPESYNLTGLLVQSGIAGLSAAKIVSALAGLAVLVVACARRSLPLAVAAALLLSPIVWLHYFVLLLVPLAARRPVLAPVWLVPLAFWFTRGSGEDVREHHIVIALLVLASVTAVVEWGPRDPRGLMARRAVTTAP